MSIEPQETFEKSGVTGQNSAPLDYDQYPIRIVEPPHLPFLISQMADPPKKLYIKGDASALSPEENASVKFLCVVGSRKHTAYGREACEQLIAGLAGQPVVIVSGLALGMDAIAHHAALGAGLRTVAVPGSGLHRHIVYPHCHFHLAHDILNAGGTLLSELPPEFPANKWTFPRRNRIMAALCHATLIIEGADRSGTLITARLASEYNRDVLAVPGSIFSENTAGTHKLIKRGAALISSSKDILEVLGIAPPATPEKVPKEATGCNEKNTSGRAPQRSDHSNYSDEERIVIQSLTQEPLDHGQLLEKSELPASTLNKTLSMLELKGAVKEMGNQFYCV